MKLLFLYVLFLTSLYNCHKPYSERAIYQRAIDDMLISNGIALKDTCIFINDDTVCIKYERNLNHKATDIIINRNGYEFKMGYSFPDDCIIDYLGIIPKYEWTNGEILCLSRSCGGYCSLFIYVNMGNWTTLERENVLSEEKNIGLISYLKNDKILIIEKLFDCKKEYFLKYKIPCNTVFLCVDIITFNDQKLFITYMNEHEEKINETFTAP